MTKHKPPARGSGTHVTFDFDGHGSGLTLNPSLPGADYLLKLGVTNIVRAFDCLGVGPSRRDVVEHARARQVWFDSVEHYDHLYSADVRWETPVVVWATPCLHDRMNLWRTCNWLRERGIPSREVLVIDLPPTPRGPGAAPRSEPFECHSSVFYHAYAALQARLGAARPWPRGRYDQAVKLWEQYVDPDFRHFARRCLRGVEGFSDLGSTWAFLSRFFPRLTADRSLRLSHYDELLLRALTPEWQTPVKVYVSDVIQERGEFMSCVGDVTMERRLAVWAAHGTSLAVERAVGPQPGPDYPMLSSVYRLTEWGRELRVRLSRLDDAPRLPVGGAEAYAPEAPWVVLEDGKLARYSL